MLHRVPVDQQRSPPFHEERQWVSMDERTPSTSNPNVGRFNRRFSSDEYGLIRVRAGRVAIQGGRAGRNQYRHTLPSNDDDER